MLEGSQEPVDVGATAVPEPSGALETSPEVTPDASPEQEPSVETPEIDQEPEASVDNPLEVMRQTADERYRKLQGTKDREIAELQAKLNASAQPQAPVQQPGETAEEFNGRAFLDMIEAGNENEAFERMQAQAEQRAVTRIDEQRKHAEYQQQFMTEFDSATSGYTEEEQRATVNIIEDHIAAGRPISPNQAAAIARFGSMDKALEYANQYASSSAKSQAVPPKVDPTLQPPAAPQHPPVMGLGGQKFSFGQQQDDGASMGALEGLYRNL